MTISEDKIRLVFVLIAIAAFTIVGQPQGNGEADTKESFYRAVSLTKTALDNLKGSEGRNDTGGIYWVGRGQYDISARMQGLNFERPDMVATTEVFGFDPKSNAVLYESKTRVNHDAREWIRFVYDGRGRLLVVNPEAKWAIWTSGPDTENQRKGYSRILPQLLLAEALEERNTLRLQGTAEVENEPVHIVNFTPKNRQTISLLISKRSGFFRGIDYLIDHPLLGDTLVRWWFDDYRKVEGFGLFPFEYKVFLGPRLLKSIEMSEVRAEFDASARTKSTDEIKIPAPPDLTINESYRPKVRTKRESPIEEIGKNVFLVKNIRGGFHVLVVEFDKYLMVVDTPAGYHELQQIPAIDWAGERNSGAVGKRLSELLRKQFPNKPVKYVVLTHHHSDHAGGIFPFLKNGTTVLGSKETLAVLNQSLKQRFMLESYEGSSATNFKQVEVAKNHKITDGFMEVEIKNVGQNPHADGMLVVYLPKQGLLYQADLFEPFEDGENPSDSRLPIMRWFVRWLEESQLDPKRIFAIHGSAVITKDQVEKVRRIANSKPE